MMNGRCFTHCNGIYDFQQIKSMSKNSHENILQLIERRRAGFPVNQYSIVKKILDSRLASDNCSDYAKKLMSLFNTFAKEIYEDNTYLKVREVFESKVEDYLHKKTDYIETFIEEVAGEIFFKRKRKLIGFTDIPASIYEINQAALQNQGIIMTVLDDWDAIC